MDIKIYGLLFWPSVLTTYGSLVAEAVCHTLPFHTSMFSPIPLLLLVLWISRWSTADKYITEQWFCLGLFSTSFSFPLFKYLVDNLKTCQNTGKWHFSMDIPYLLSAKMSLFPLFNMGKHSLVLELNIKWKCRWQDLAGKWEGSFSEAWDGVEAPGNMACLFARSFAMLGPVCRHLAM